MRAKWNCVNEYLHFVSPKIYQQQHVHKQDKNILPNKRPINLLNMYYKVAKNVFANALKSVYILTEFK